MKMSVNLMRFGTVAPESGPSRDEYLRTNGGAFLENAARALTEVAAVLGDCRLPVIESLSGHAEDDRLHVDAAIVRWREIRESFAEVIEDQLRKPIEAGVSSAINALNYLEDTELREVAHELVHQASSLRSGFLGCKLWVDNGAVHSDCPVRIAHLRWGISPEIKVDWVCSICNERFDTCSHIPDQEYEVAVNHSNGSCSVCSERSCAHLDGQRMLASARRIASRIEKLVAVALVARPRDPEARVQSLELVEAADPELRRRCENGTAVCTECILPCTGFVEFDALKG